MPTEPTVYHCPRSCYEHEGRTYPSLEAVIKHVELQHPDHDPDWWKGPNVDWATIKSR